MANTYTQIYIHIVYAVKHRDMFIAPSWKERLHKYTTGIVQNQGHKLIAINSMPDHMHKFWRHNSLSLVFFVLFIISLAGQFYTGFNEYNKERQEDGQPPVTSGRNAR